jgi:hypothetical protein
MTMCPGSLGFLHRLLVPEGSGCGNDTGFRLVVQSMGRLIDALLELVIREIGDRL